jgi:predicted O-linked N-acetylglucosamine transferase (SPINDLY family)
LNLGRAKLKAGDYQGAAQLLARASSQLPGDVDCLVDLGEAYCLGGRLPDALDAFLRALPLRPSSAPLTAAMGRLMVGMGEGNAALWCLERAATLDPSNVNEATRRVLATARARGARPAAEEPLTDRLSVRGLLAFARALERLGRNADALALCERALARDPASAAAHNVRGAVLLGLGRHDEALDCFQRVVTLDPGGALGHANLATVLQRCGRVAEACEAFRRSLALGPDQASIRSSLVYTLSFHPADDAHAILSAAREWNDRHAAPFLRTAPHGNDHTPGRRLRVGYLSPDFAEHCQAMFTTPLFRHHDRQSVEVFCYSWTPRPDAVTARLAELADQWRDLRPLDDSQAASLIESDQIDVLVDLTMHMGNNRLGILARRPAPVQVAWLAYPGTTGLAAMDYRITDPYLDPPDGDDSVYSEASIRLPDTFWCYDPLAEPGGEDVTPLPALSKGHVTFGCLNNYLKIHDGVLALWADVLRAVSGSRLVLRAPEGRTREQALAVLSEHGVSPERVTMVPWRLRGEYLASYSTIDVGLDPFPYGGHTTSLDAFWMGVPVVTLVGRTLVSRAGLCMAMNLGMPELVAHSPDEFVRTAVDLCADLPRLARTRAGLRARMERSPLMDAPRFARNIEAAFRGAWQRWCDARGGPA